MEFIEVVRKRRSVRDYTDEPVDPGVIETLIEVACQAPSARNVQPWSFWVILGRPQLDDLAAGAKEWLVKEVHEHGMYSPVEQLATSPGFSIFYHAPALVLVVATSQTAQAVQDCCLAGELLMLAARDAGLASCWIGLACPWFLLPSTKALFGIPRTYCVAAPIILGHPKEWPCSHGRTPPTVHWWAHANNLSDPEKRAE